MVYKSGLTLTGISSLEVRGSIITLFSANMFMDIYNLHKVGSKHSLKVDSKHVILLDGSLIWFNLCIDVFIKYLLLWFAPIL